MGLVGSSMVLFGRVVGGIYTKVADVGADIVGKVEKNIPDDDPRYPAVIANNIGVNVGDIVVMGSDLSGSYAESSCTTLLVESISSYGVNHELTAMLYPLLVSSIGVIFCSITTLSATDFFEVNVVKEIESSLKKQLIISVALMTLGMLSTLTTGLAIDAYGSIGDNSGAITETAGMSQSVRERTDALDATGNTTTATGKGFVIGFAALLSLALFGAFVSHASILAPEIGLLAELAAAKVVVATLCKVSILVGGLYSPSLMSGAPILGSLLNLSVQHVALKHVTGTSPLARIMWQSPP